MVKVTGPAISLASSIPLRKKRSPFLPPAPPQPPPPEHINVVDGEVPPVPNCSGTYNYFDILDGEHSYRRTTEPFFYLYFWALIFEWIIADSSNPEAATIFWLNHSGPSGLYESSTGAEGSAIASEVFP